MGSEVEVSWAHCLFWWRASWKGSVCEGKGRVRFFVVLGGVEEGWGMRGLLFLVEGWEYDLVGGWVRSEERSGTGSLYRV